jgi:hypothetical protein
VLHKKRNSSILLNFLVVDREDHTTPPINKAWELLKKQDLSQDQLALFEGIFQRAGLPTDKGKTISSKRTTPQSSSSSSSSGSSSGSSSSSYTSSSSSSASTKVASADQPRAK